MIAKTGNSNFDPRQFRAAIFDLDGTLVHSEPAWERAKTIVALRHGKVPSQAMLDAYVGRGLRDFLDALFEGALTNEERRNTGAEIVLEADLLLDQLRAPILGARDWLAGLARDGLRIAICSSSPRRQIDAAIDFLGIAGLVELSVSAAELARGKPDPLPFLTTLDRLELPPELAFAVEDSLPGAISAIGAGLFTVAVGTGCTRPAFDFCQLQAENFAELASFV